MGALGRLSLGRAGAPVRREAVAPGWRALALLVAWAFFMENLDGTIIATAAVRMARSFAVAPVQLNVAITAYLLALGVFIPVSGWMADRFGARAVFCSAIAVFTLASATCAVTANLGQLTAARVLQGLGGAMMVPVGRLIVLRAAEKRDIIRVVAYLTWPGLVAPVLAPAVGGALVTYASWRWIFLVNIPLGALALAVALRIVPTGRPPRAPVLDWAGFVLTGVGLGAAVSGLELVTGAHVPWARTAVLLVVGAVVIAGAVVHLLRKANPLLDLRVLKVPTFVVPNRGGSLYRMAINATPFVLTLLFQQGFGWSPLRAGAVVLAVFVGNLTVKPLTTPLLQRFGFRSVLVSAAAMAGVTLVLCATFSPTTPVLAVLVVLVASGAFRSIGFTAYNTIVFADIPSDEMSNANTLSSTVQRLTAGLGVAVGALALRAGAPTEELFGLSARGVRPYSAAFVLLALMCFVAAFEAARLEPAAGAELAMRTAGGRR